MFNLRANLRGEHMAARTLYEKLWDEHVIHT